MIGQVAMTNDTRQIGMLMSALDDTRLRRQKLVMIAFTNESARPPAGFRQRLDTYWCAVKHILLVEGHIEEAIANAARAKDSSGILKLGKELHGASKKRRALIATIMGAGNYGAHSGCMRCKGDLQS
jgi:hypothetical protein